MNKSKRTLLVSAIINGIPMQINPASIDKSKRTLLHGEYKGTPVNSPAICHLGDKPGDTVLFWPDSEKPFAVAMSKPNLGVLATKFLQAEGHTVTLKA